MIFLPCTAAMGGVAVRNKNGFSRRIPLSVRPLMRDPRFSTYTTMSGSSGMGRNRMVCRKGLNFPDRERCPGRVHQMVRQLVECIVPVSEKVQASLPSDLTDNELARRIAAGDEVAFEALMRKYNRMLYRVARAILRNDAEAEDALQLAYLQAYR